MNFKIMKRFIILAMMLVCLGWVSFAENSIQVVEAARCCDTCPGGGDPSTVSAVCYDYCFSTIEDRETVEACFNQCVAQAHACYDNCDPSCGGGDTCGISCSSSFDCFGGSGYCGFCIQGTCQ